MSSQLHLHEEFTAIENAYTDILKKPILDSKGATSNNLTVQANNLSSEKGDKEEKQTTRMGLLTFDVNPELEDNKHVYLATVKDQANLIRWPAAIHLALWPYVLRSAVNLHNTLPVLEDGISRLECFSSIRIGRKMKHYHAFGCPVFALENDNAAGSPIPHWSPLTRLRVNLSSSPSHARNVSLVLNLHMGCVSPQYHCHFDDFFDMVRHSGPVTVTLS